MTRHKNQTSRARRHTRHLKLQGGVNPQITQLTINNVINTNEEFNTRKHDFVTIYETDPDMLYNIKELSPSTWKFGYLVTNRFTPRTRDELNDALQLMFPAPKNNHTMQPIINSEMLLRYGPLATWDTRFITDMSDLSEYMHYDIDDTWPYDISNWNMQKVTSMQGMFAKCKNLKRVDVSKWRIPKVRFMAYMFLQCERFERLDFINETPRDFLPFDVYNVIDMEGMFKECVNLHHLDLSTWEPANLEIACKMFALCSNLQSLTFNLYENTDVRVGKMFFGVSNTAHITTNFTPWQWYLSNLSFENLPIPIESTKTPSPLMSQCQLELLSTIHYCPNWFGAHTRRVFEWQDLDDVDVWGMVYFGHYKNDLYKQRRLRAVLMYLYNEETPDLPCLERCNTPGRKQWSNVVSDELSTFKIGNLSDNFNIKNAEILEENAFAAFINAENRASKLYSDDTPSQTVLVGALVHGEYNCNLESLEMPMFTIPEGKSLIIISVATPGDVSLTNSHYLDDEIIIGFQERLQDPNFRVEMDHNPIHIAKIIQTICEIDKLKSYQKALEIRDSSIIQVTDFFDNYEESRILYFKSGDNCANKIFNFESSETSKMLMKMVSICENACKNTEKNLEPPRQRSSKNNTAMKLSELCYQLFTLSEHSTIILVDFTCSVFVDASDEYISSDNVARTQIANKAFQLRFGGGSNNNSL